MKQLFSNTKRSRLRSALILLIGCITALSALPAYGQNVTISPSSGHLIAALTYENEVGFQNGWSALWRHNQLPLSLHVSDKPDLTSSGVLKDPAGNIRLDTDRKLYVLMGGETVTTHMSFSLPKGFRFTGYRMVLLNDMNGKSYGGFDLASISKRMYETNSSFSYSSPLASTAEMSGNNDGKEYVIERTSKTASDMGNNLYFYFWRASNALYGATIKSIELYFTAEAEFQAEGVPGAPDEIISDGVNMVGTEFTTGKLDLGIIKPNTKNGKTYYSYDYQNVIDLTAKNWLYQENAVTDGKLPETAGSGNIQVLQNDGKLYYALGNGTYYIETPTETKNQNGKSIPLGYRITGAQIKAHYGTQADASPITYDGKMGTISYTTGLFQKTTYYLQTDGSWDTSPTTWKLTNTRRLQSGKYYLSVQKSSSGNREQYIAKGTEDLSQASTFSVSNNKVMWGNYYLSHSDNREASFTSFSYNAATWTDNQASVTNPAYKPSNFKLELFGTNKDNVERTEDVSSSNTDVTLSVSSLNNDAVKFTISGLKEGTKALITYNLTMEQLNPFINTLDIVCHSKKMAGQTITQQFTSNDFQVAGGAFHFYVPAAFADENNNCTFTFENLTSKYMDPTYGHGTNGNGRNYFVKSAYYNTYGDGKQYNATGNEEASTKVSTTWCANQPFKYNNAHELANDNISATATTLEEYPYSEARYTASDGSGTTTGKQGTFTDNIELQVNSGSKDCYLTTGDETRYNIAPTTAMEHRYYAFYLMKIDLDVKEYDAYCRMTKLYDATCYEGDKEKAMWGGTFEAYDKETGQQIPSDQAFLSVSMMVDALKAAEKRHGFTADQVLYLDYTNLYSVLVESKESMAEMKAKLNPNCLIFFPQRTVYNEDNYVSKTLSGDYRACKNIIITDKQPFYSPYKITVPAENYASYTRKVTHPLYGKATLATLVLPFSIELSDGVHSNGSCSFTLSQMVPENCLDINNDRGGEGSDFYVKASFRTVDAARTTPNTPYMVTVEKASADDDTSFEILQYGSDVEATAEGSGNNMNKDDYTFAGESATGSINGSTYNFTNYGSYAGKKLDKTIGWFYFAQGKFYNSKNLSEKYDYVYVYPFRAYFSYNKTGGAKDMDGFEVSFDEPTSIGFTPTVSDNGLNIKGGHGRLTLYASSETPVSIASASGALVWRATVEPNQPQTVTLPSGLYIVNGKKVIIR